MSRRRTILYPALASCLAFPALSAQGEIRGRVLADSTGVPVGGAELRLLGLSSNVTSDSAGRFALAGIPTGGHLLVVRAVGFAADTSEVEFSSNETLFKDVVLRRVVQPLAPVNVRASETRIEGGWRGDFTRRREAGVGRQLDRSLLEKYSSRTISDLLATQVPGVEIRRGNGSKTWVASGRAVSPGGCAFCRGGPSSLDPGDVAQGARPACYMDVYLDGVNVYTMSQGAGAGKAPPLCDMSTLRPQQIEAIEVYTSAAQIPAQYNKTSSGCGVLLIWTRI